MARIKAKMKAAAGADTTAVGEPDYPKMLISVMHRLASTRSQGTGSGAKRDYKGIPTGGDY